MNPSNPTSHQQTQPSSTFNIITWNCNGFYTRLPDLQILLQEYKPQVLALQETHLHPTKSINLRNYAVYSHSQISTLKSKGGVLLAIEQKIYAEHINLTTPLQAVAARIFAPSPLTICSIYIPPTDMLRLEELTSLISSLPSPILLLGDFNAHSPSWGGHYINQHGKIIEECIDILNLTILNTKPTHLNAAHHTWTTIDLVISSASIANSTHVYSFTQRYEWQ